MAWDDRIVDAIYTSPSGKETTFKIDEAAHEVPLKTATFTFPDKDGGRVQHQGAGAKTFPITAIFDGPDCMDQADAFEAMLIERGVAEFQHPAYGTRKVVPTGNIKRKDGLVSELNVSSVGVTLTETIVDEEVPALDIVTADNIDALYEDFAESAAADFAEGISADTVSEQLQAQSALMDQANALNENLGGLASAEPGKSAQFLTTIKELKSNIQGYFNQAEKVTQKGLSIGRQVLYAMKAPSRMIVSVTEKIKGYTQLITQMANQFKNDPFGTKNKANAFASARLVLTGAVASIASGSALAVVNAAARIAGTALSPGTGIMSREAAIGTALQIGALLDSVKEFEDSKVEQDVFIDYNASSYFQLQQLVYASIQLIINASFSLPMRRTITLDRDRQVIELCCELYGSEEHLDRFIQENNFTLDEIELLSMGKEVSYHVESA
jgi:hypothetical protein